MPPLQELNSVSETHQYGRNIYYCYLQNMCVYVSVNAKKKIWKGAHKSGNSGYCREGEWDLGEGLGLMGDF